VKEALLYQKLKKQQVRCNLCQRRCLIPEGGIGYCKTRINKKGKLYTTIYALASAVNNDPIEKKPVFHYKPGSQCLSLGTFGCNLRCKFCQNWDISWADGIVEAERGTKISPQQAIKMAQKYHSKGIAITYNEPTVWLEYSLDVFKLAKKNNLYTVWVTNGYATKEAIDVIAPYLDVYRVDLKSFDNRFYQKLTNVPKAKPIFETTKYIHQEYPQIHLECITNIIPGWNDSDKNLKQIAQWIFKNLGPKTPWHVTRFFPYAELSNLPPTPPQTLFRAREIGLKQGLQFVYIGNMEVEKEDDTICPKCGNLAVRRTGYLTEVLGVDQKGRCLDCQENLNIKR
jgi:pyruvate formate lyase activating enzyme